MPPILDNELLNSIQEGVAGTAIQVGFRVQYPWKETAGFFGLVAKPGFEAFSRKTAESLIAAVAAREGISDEGFTLLPIAAMFVK